MSVPFLVTLFVFIYTRFVKQFVFDIHNQMFHFLVNFYVCIKGFIDSLNNRI